MYSEYTFKKSRPRYLCRWWMKTRVIEEKIPGQPLNEFYCPLWAKPLDWLWKKAFGLPKLVRTVNLDRRNIRRKRFLQTRIEKTDGELTCEDVLEIVGYNLTKDIRTIK